jgi:hypothetical protein
MNRLRFARVSGTGTVPAHLAGLLGVAIFIAACDGGASSPTSGTQPSTTGPATATFTLSGAVWEMTGSGPAPIKAARVTEMGSGRVALTDTSGLYSIPELSAASHTLSIAREGYITQTTRVTLSGDTQLDVRLERVESYTLSGVVFELTAAGQVPIEGVQIYCDSCGSPDGHTWVYTDAGGAYSLAWAVNGRHPLYVIKAGYDIFDPAGTLRDAEGRITPSVHGDTRFDVQLVKR